jgi:hypothetical protein
MLPIPLPHSVCARADLLLAPTCFRHRLSRRPQDHLSLWHHHGPSPSSSAGPEMCGSAGGQLRGTPMCAHVMLSCGLLSYGLLSSWAAVFMGCCLMGCSCVGCCHLWAAVTSPEKVSSGLLSPEVLSSHGWALRFINRGRWRALEDPVSASAVCRLKVIIVARCMVIGGGSGAQQNAVRQVIFGFTPDPARKHYRVR